MARKNVVERLNDPALPCGCIPDRHMCEQHWQVMDRVERNAWLLAKLQREGRSR